MSDARFFHRPELAGRIASRVMSEDPVSAAASGLFLSAPRRTGKSTFLREDLIPELRARGAIVLYADLWKDQKADPGVVITNVVREALSDRAPVLAKLARRLGIEEAINLGALKLSPDKLLGAIGLGADISLADALAALSDEAKRTIVLIVDEAQHAMTTENGRAALFALKAARDEINSSAHHGLRIVATGSNQEKLAMLRNSKDQAFFLAPMATLPHLDQRFVAWFCNVFHLDETVDPARIGAIFEKCAFRPEILMAAMENIRNDFSDVEPSTPLADKIERQAMQVLRDGIQEQLRIVHSLTPLQSSVFRVMAVAERDYAPFETQTLEKYRAVLRATAPGETVNVDAASVQSALEGLQSKNLVWKEARGIYAIEDRSIREVLADAGMLDCVPGFSPPAGEHPT